MKVVKLYDTRVLGIVVAEHTVTMVDTVVSEQGARSLHQVYDGVRCDSL